MKEVSHMSNTVVGILGIVTIVAIVVTLFKSKTQPAIAFIVFPAILGLVLVLGGRFLRGTQCKADRYDC